MTARRPRLAFPRRALGGPASFRVGVALLTLVVALCVVVPLVWSSGPEEIVAAPYAAPSGAHPFGTDSVGRDLFVRTFAGGRIDLLVAATVIGVALAVGTLVGTLAGVARRPLVDAVVMRVVDAFVAFPLLILLLVLIVLIGPTRRIGPAPAGLPATLIAFVIAGWAYYARLARAQALSLRDRDHVTAARVLGFSHARIVLRHVLPGVVRVTAAYAVGDAILVVVFTASLAFIGAGVQPPTAEWGSIMYEGRAYLETAWWITLLPGAVLALTGLAVTLIADSRLARVGGRDVRPTAIGGAS